MVQKTHGVVAAFSALALTAACSTTPEPVAEVEEVVTETVDYAEAFKTAVGDRVYFDYDKWALKEGARETLAAQADWLNMAENSDVRVMVSGHADERGTREYNLVLGEKRAKAVKDYLVGQGVSAERIDTISYGEMRPMDAGSDETAWSKNRNAHTSVMIVAGGVV